jgi:autotransporter adhesin
MNKSYKSILNRSTGTYVAASENVKSAGKSAKSKLAKKVASASLAFGASVALLSTGDAFADEGVDVGASSVQAQDESGVLRGVQATDDSASDDSAPASNPSGPKLLGRQLLGATQTGASVLYDDSTGDSISFAGAAGTRLSNVAAGTVSTDATNFGQLLGTAQSVATALGGGAAVDANGRVTAPTYTLGGTAYNDVGSALTGLDERTTSNETAISNLAASGNKYIGVGSAGNAAYALATAVAIGPGATATGNTSLALGSGTVAATNGSMAIGSTAKATGVNAQAIGSAASVSGQNSIAAGFSASASANQAAAYGYMASIGTSGASSVALGYYASANVSNAVALGAGSVANRANTVSVGKAGSERQVANVAAGTQGTDAVNYGQLIAAGLKTDTNGAATNSFVAYDDNTASTVTLNPAGTKIKNVAAGDVSSAESTEAVNGGQLFTINQSVAESAAAIAANTGDIATNAAAIAVNTSGIAQNTGDISTINTQVGTLNTQMADAVKYDSAAHDTMTLSGASGTKITNVAAGDISSANSTDAVNGGQLYATNQNVAQNTAAIAEHAGEIADNTSAISANTSAIASNTSDIAANTAEIATNTSGIAQNTSDIAEHATAIAANTADIAANTSGIAQNTSDIAAHATAIAANTADIATNTSGIAQNTSDISAINTQVGTINTQLADAVKYDSAAHDTMTLSGASGTKITNVAAGDVSSADSTDAVNGSQLYATNQNVSANAAAIAANTADIATNASGIAQNTSDIAEHATAIAANTADIAANKSGIAQNTSDIAEHATAIAANTADIAANTSGIAQNTSDISSINTQLADAVKYDSAAHDTMTLSGVSGTKITNVAAGDISSADSTDAVNGSQLYATNQNVAANATAIAANTADIASNTSSISANTSAIAANTSDIAEHATAIAANTADIAANTADIAANTSGIAQNTSDISTINTQVGTLNTQMADAVKYDSAAHDTMTLRGASGTKITNVAAGDISSADSTDAVNGSQLYATNQDVSANATAIAANTADIAANASGIAQNTSDIAEHATAIAANTADIAANTSGIAQNTSDISTINTQLADAVKYDSTTHDTMTLSGASGTKITNVAAGDISSADSTDAVNGSQLYATNQNVAANATAIAANTDDIASNTSAISANTSAISANTSDIAEHATAIAANTADIAANTSGIAQNTSDIAEHATAIAANTADIAANTSGIAQNTSDISAINTQVGTINTQLADAVKYDSASHDTMTLSGASGTKITNVAAGDISSADSTDAVNGSQLYATNQNVADNATAIAANTSDIARNTADIATNTSGIAQNTADIGTLNTQMADAVKYDAGSDHASMTLGGASGTVIKNVAAGQVSADSMEAVNGSQLFSVQQSVGEQGAILADAVRYDSSSHDKITLGDPTAGPVALTNVKAGDVSETSTDAVNGSQLYTVSQDVVKNTADIASLNTSMNDLSNGTAGLVRQDPVTQALSIGANTNGDTISFVGLQGARVLTGVANGMVSSASQDAVNGSQLFNTSTSVAAALGGGASVDANGGVTAPSYTVGGKQVNDVGSAVSNLDGRVTQNSADIAGLKGDLADVSKTAANAVAYDSADHSKVTLGGTDASAGVKLTNVADGDLSATSTDAVNGSQLNATNARVSATESAIEQFQASGVSGSTATGDGAAAIGSNADASGTSSTAAGANAAASGDQSTAAGANSIASGDQSTATGANATASGSNSTAAGANSMASGDSSVAFGGNAAASGSNAVSIGGNSQASGSGSVAFGGNSSATADNSVALGANSVADEANTVSVGSAGNERRVTNVAPGVNGTDATNVNQLNALRNDVNSSMTTLRRAALGGVAAAMAMPNLMPSAPGKTVVGAGVANYKGYNAFAAGATYRSENSRWLVNGAVSVTQNGDAGVRAQAGYEF